MKSQKLLLPALLLFLFVFRVIYGICADFWSEDELQIFLIGLKSYTTQTWPSYGPDVVYTNTQIPGALQGLLIRLPLTICPMPEAPIVFLCLLTFSSLAFFSWYCYKRIGKNLSLPLILMWFMSLTWTMDFGNKVVNPSYVLPFSILFFIAAFELLPIFEKPLLKKGLSWFLLGITPPLIMQLHMSFVLLLPFAGIAIFYELKGQPFLAALKHLATMALGVLIGLLTLFPTLLNPCPGRGVAANVVLNWNNFENVVAILTKYLSFASYEIPYVMGDTPERIDIVTHAWWSVPFIAYLVLFYFALIGIYIYVYFKNKEKGAWDKIKKLTFISYVLLFISFFFSIKGPVPHTFYILFPLIAFYSMYCLAYMVERFKEFKRLMHIAVFSSMVFYLAMGLHNFNRKSMYTNRDLVLQAIHEKNHLILGKRRSETWPCNY